VAKVFPRGPPLVPPSGPFLTFPFALMFFFPFSLNRCELDLRVLRMWRVPVFRVSLPPPLRFPFPPLLHMLWSWFPFIPPLPFFFWCVFSAAPSMEDSRSAPTWGQKKGLVPPTSEPSIFSVLFLVLSPVFTVFFPGFWCLPKVFSLWEGLKRRVPWQRQFPFYPFSIPFVPRVRSPHPPPFFFFPKGSPGVEHFKRRKDSAGTGPHFFFSF